jgi:signal peptidase I
MPKLFNELRVYFVYFFVTAIVTISIYAIARNYAFIPVEINGDSMFPFHKTKDKIYIDKFSPLFSTFRRGEVVVLLPNIACDPKSDLFIKRIIGLPGEKVIFENGEVSILNPNQSDTSIKLDETDYLSKDVKTYKSIVPSNDLVKDNQRVEEVILGQDEYYFMGDNRQASQDSRRCGGIKKDKIIGREFYKWFPSESKTYFKLPNYKNIGN